MSAGTERNLYTGGTALSVFYLGHRISDDIDLFSTESIALPEIDFWIKIQWIKWDPYRP
ncbi:MAG: nucleotidyl transferase AbiEii/AbiGii toxin family protein [Deltaproteobacteria bacterium]|nr:nucleotidyl transferase AbiEii/AbiGii toxin family protein [Deltaproteobacteria bacterium]